MTVLPFAEKMDCGRNGSWPPSNAATICKLGKSNKTSQPNTGRERPQGRLTHPKKAELMFLFRLPHREAAPRCMTPARCPKSPNLAKVSEESYQRDMHATTSERESHAHYVHRKTTSHFCLVTRCNLFVGVVCFGGDGFLPF